MNFKALTTENNYARVDWISNGQSTFYYLTETDTTELIKKAKTIIDILSIREVNDNSIDFNCGILEIFDKETNEWCDFYDEDGRELNDIDVEY